MVLVKPITRIAFALLSNKYLLQVLSCTAIWFNGTAKAVTAPQGSTTHWHPWEGLTQ